MSSIKKRRRFNRSVGTREYRKVITIFPEGEKTENAYFTILKPMVENINVIIKRGNKKTEPNQVLKRAKEYLKNNKLSKNEQVWLVFDVDHRLESSFKNCQQWEKTNDKYNLAISNPNFEYWLLLHFARGDDIRSTTDLMRELKKHLPHYNKSNLNSRDITKEHCDRAIANGRKRHRNNNGEVEVLQIYCSTVYRLVEEIFEVGK